MKKLANRLFIGIAALTVISATHQLAAQTITPSALATPTPPANAATVAAAATLLQHTKDTAHNLLAARNAMFTNFWQNSSASPSAIASAMGTQAVSFFTLAANLDSYLTSIGYANQLLNYTGATVTTNTDGTITISGSAIIYTGTSAPTSGT